MPRKKRTWRAMALDGRARPSQHNPWGTYVTPGYLCSEEVLSNSHHRVGNGSHWSGGGPLYLVRDTKEWRPKLHVFNYDGVGNLLFDGSVRIATPAAAYEELVQPLPLADWQLDADGTTAIARTEPLNPAFDLSVFLGELRAEGLPNLPGTAVRDKVKLAKASGSEYLNIEFGWLPLVRGIRDFADTVIRSDELVRSHQENANRVIQRGYEWPEERDTRAVPMRHVAENGHGFFERGGLHQSIFRKKWFEAEYIYYLPTGGNFNDRIRRYASYARKLYGIDLSPEVLWNLSPWSWAADWFGNTGDVMHNISALGQDGLVMRNGYIMYHCGKRTVQSGFWQDNPLYYQTCITVNESKQRRPATPYGFGISYDGLSAKQIAILAALGLSRW